MEACEKALLRQIGRLTVAFDRLLQVGGAVGAEADLLAERLPAKSLFDGDVALKADRPPRPPAIDAKLHVKIIPKSLEVGG